MHIGKIQYAQTNLFSDLVIDHLNDADDIRPFRPSRQSVESCMARAHSRLFSDEVRADLVQVLLDQYEGLECSQQVWDNLDELGNENTFTVTTGHQCVLGTGPWFFPLKVLNVIRVAKELGNADPSRNYVPVLWLATEDHDREEIDHVFINSRKVQWPGPVGGPVGRMHLSGIDPFLDTLEHELGAGKRAKEVMSKFRMAYRPDRTLAAATRHLANELFGEYGLVILDADEPRLKRHFKAVMKEEITAQSVQKEVEKTNTALELKYKVQVNPRNINLFHIGDHHRERITRNGQEYGAGEIKWTEIEILDELDRNPGNFSPNVLMRPLYQECILPNIAYIGGGGELAYWMQLQSTFESFNVPYPVIMLRTSLMWVAPKVRKKMDQIDMKVIELFGECDAYKADRAKGAGHLNTGVAEEIRALKRLFEEIEGRVKEEGLKTAIRARATRSENDLLAIEKKLIRSAKRSESELMDRIDYIFDSLLPGGSLQERKENFATLYMEMGEDWAERLLKVLDPFDKQFTVIG
jgi:bacillithiol biosynthesis cysteine-adding enzyme BshC